MSTRAPFLLASYSDLRTARGPLHARATADLGRRYLAGEPLPPFQVVTPGNLRRALADDLPGATRVDDPRHLPDAPRSAAWALLCTELDGWHALPTARMHTTAKVLTRLGFWAALAGLPLPPPPRPSAPAARLEHLGLVHRHGVARLVAGWPGPPTAADSRGVLTALADDRELPPAARLGAALNLLVGHARSDRSMPDVLHWRRRAEALLRDAPPSEVSPTLRSAYWRAVSFVPFLRGDHTEVRRMLDESERLAREEVREAGPSRALLARENLRLVLMTRARAASGAGDPQRAEGCFRALVRCDPLDSTSHVLLADFLVTRDRVAEALAGYRRAARLGAPWTAYARAQAARCAEAVRA
uniref:Tetratricopeptide repeat protein n=1 Tax=Streptomyces sp. NBC_00049 TaxID=2903617 RepID=A0AAU2JW13_9ACTN